MANINSNLLKLEPNYVFPEISRKVEEYKLKYPENKVISLGVGDVILPLPNAVIEAMHLAIDEMSDESTFRGYGPEIGYEFLRDIISKKDYKTRNIDISSDEIFINDGINWDATSMFELFDNKNNEIGIISPCYPAFFNGSIMWGKSGVKSKEGYWNGITYIEVNEENNFVPQISNKKLDIICLCLPNNPTSTTINKNELKKWVDYALENQSIILYDAAYEAYVRDKNVARSIYEIEGAKKVAIEFRSFSKNAGFTGIRCGFTIVPKELQIKGTDRILNDIWRTRQCTKTNGVSYITQRGAEAIYTDEGQKQVERLVNYYMRNLDLIRESLKNIGYVVYGGENAPYVWIKLEGNQSSWEFFNYLLLKYNIVGVPGSAFGPSGEGYFRLSSFAKYEDVIEAMNRLENIRN